MEMLDVDNWDSEVRFSRSADSPFGALAQSRGDARWRKIPPFLGLKESLRGGKGFNSV